MSEFDQYASSWHQPDGPMGALHQIHPVRMAFIKPFLPKEPLRILDAGCAGGLISLDLAALGHQVTGIDLSLAMIQQAEIKSKEQDLSIDWIQSPIQSFQSEQNFDMIICSEVLEHIDEPLSALQHLISMLAPKGTLIVSTINRTLNAFISAIIGAEYLFNIVPKGTHRFDGLIDSRQLISFVEKEGLSLSRLSGISYNPLSKHAQLTRDTSVNFILAAKRPKA